MLNKKIKPYIKLKDSIDKTTAKNKIIDCVLYGENSIDPRPKTWKEAESYINKLNNSDELVEQVRFNHLFAPFCNILPTTWNAYPGDGQIEIIDKETDKSKLIIKDTGEFGFVPYLSQFEASVRYLNFAIERSSFDDCVTALSKGFYSIEAYINNRAIIWNRLNPTQPLTDTTENKVRFKIKIDKWIPLMTGQKVDKSRIDWKHFLEVKNIREKLEAHNHNEIIGGSYEQLCVLINYYKTGIAQFLANLHMHFGQRIPTCIINAIYLPDVEIV